jgi:hypothetical protein
MNFYEGGDTVTPNKADLVLLAIEQRSIPKDVYKYRGLGEYTDDIIQNQKLWFSSASDFNDPFDCNLSETNNHTLSDFQSWLDTQNVAPKEKATYVSHFHQDPSRVRDVCLKNWQDATNSKGILALSKTNSNILMWSHYADKHEGVVLVFDMTRDPGFFVTPMNVIYGPNYTALNYFRDGEKAILANLTTKADLWSHEQEIRIIKKSKGLHPFDPDCLREVFFGCRTSDNDILRFKQLCQNHGFGHVTFKKAERVRGAFSLRFVPA